MTLNIIFLPHRASRALSQLHVVSIMAAIMYVPMTDEARKALITISVLWVAFAVVVGFRWLGRIRGAGIGADDVLSLVALVCLERH
jgi:hypothetical protein